MLSHSITFVDFNGNSRTKEILFNLTEAEMVQLQLDSPRGIQAEVQDAIDNNDLRGVLAFIKKVVHAAYGEKSEDGLNFHKSDELRENFISSALYSPLLLSLFEDEGRVGAKFIRDLMPADLIARAEAQAAQIHTPQDRQAPQQPNQGFQTHVVPETIPQAQPSAREMFDQRVQQPVQTERPPQWGNPSQESPTPYNQ